MNSQTPFMKLFLILSFSFITLAASPADYNINSLPFYNDALPYEMYSGFLPISVVDAKALSMD